MRTVLNQNTRKTKADILRRMTPLEISRTFSQSKRVRMDEILRRLTPETISNPEPTSVAVTSLPEVREVNRRAIFLTGGIGDIFATESFLSDEDRQEIHTIYYASRKGKVLQTLFRALPNYPRLENHIDLWDYDTDQDMWCFYSLADYGQKIGRLPVQQEPWDLSILLTFQDIKNKQLEYHGSSLLDFPVADISHWNLPENYIVICPYSTDKRDRLRDFSRDEWNKCIKQLRRTRQYGVILNEGYDKVVKDPQLIDLSNQTTILQAIEVLKKSSGYVGIDSSLSVLAAQLFQYPDLLIKSRNPSCYANADCYFPTQTCSKYLSKYIKFSS